MRMRMLAVLSMWMTTQTMSMMGTHKLMVNLQSNIDKVVEWLKKNCMCVEGKKSKFLTAMSHFFSSYKEFQWY